MLFAVALLLDAAPAANAQPATCRYEPSTRTVVIEAREDSVPSEVRLFVESGAITFESYIGPVHRGTQRQPCGSATTSNTDVIIGGGTSESTILILIADQSGGAFAPGSTSEQSGVSEIEFELRTEGLVVFQGATIPTVVRLGTLGANINGDDDADVNFYLPAASASFGYVGTPGDDDIGASGGYGTGDPATIAFVASGGEGDDRIVAGLGKAFLHGQGGSDVVVGSRRDDLLFGGDGGDRLTGRRGDDRLAGTDGNDRLRGGPGRDLLQGGKGRDRCAGGPGDDTPKKCER